MVKQHATCGLLLFRLREKFGFSSGMDIIKYLQSSKPWTLAVMLFDFKLNMKPVISFIFLLLCISSYGQFRLIKLDSSGIPLKFKYFGHIINAVKWTDSLGLNYVITTEIDSIQGKPASIDDYRDASLSAYHFVVNGDSSKLLWKVYDFNKECPVDLDLYFINKTFAVTDLDKNGIAEVWIMYKNYCHGDVSPVPTKIIMYEGNTKYALRGESKVQISENEFIGGNYKLDDNLRKGNVTFRQFAEKLWAQNKNEKWQR